MKQEIRYALMDPTANRTILVATPMPAQQQPAVAARLMAAEPTAEQTGFLSDGNADGIALRMAGGEFCANATMSAAVYHGMRTGQTSGIVTVHASGAPAPVEVEIKRNADDRWQGIVHMPRPLSVKYMRFSDGQTCPVVSFHGISHVIIEREQPTPDAEATAKRRCSELSADALGMMFWDREAERLTPLVYVPTADTLFWEKSCGSGTAAVGAFLAQESGRTVSVALQQPGGVLQITASSDGILCLQGTVRRLYEKTMSL